jgi:hypothetical protein
LDLSDPGLNSDSVISALLGLLLAMSVTPRELHEGRSLESRFLEVTGGGGT